MKGKLLLLLLLALLTFSFCSQKNEDAAGGGQENIRTPARARKAAAAKKIIEIKTVSLIPGLPTVLHDMIAVPQMADASLKNVNYQYQWFVNDKEVSAATSAMLARVNYKKGAQLYCQVKAVSADGESPWVKSDIMRVGNALPILNLAPVPPCSVPGIFRYKINAGDPDNDELTFVITAPENQGISLEVESGLLSWKIGLDTVKRLGEAIPIQFDVIDSDGGKTSGAITLNIQRTK